MSDVLPRYVVFIGNPGTGNSTLLNGFIGSAEFKSGVSFGTGLTSKVQTKEINGIIYGDTPGLSDTKKRKEAAEEIEKMLKKNGEYRILFVCTLEAGRVRPDDIATIRLVLGAISVPIQYGIIINKIPKPTMKKILEDKQAKMDLFTSLNLGHKETLYFYFYEKEMDWEDVDNIVPVLKEDFRDFIEELPGTTIVEKDVSSIKIEDYEKLQKEFEEKLEQLKADKKHMEQTYKQQMENLRGEIQQIRAERERMEQAHKQQVENLKGDIENLKRSRRRRGFFRMIGDLFGW